MLFGLKIIWALAAFGATAFGAFLVYLGVDMTPYYRGMLPLIGLFTLGVSVIYVMMYTFYDLVKSGFEMDQPSTVQWIYLFAGFVYGANVMITGQVHESFMFAIDVIVWFTIGWIVMAFFTMVFTINLFDHFEHKDDGINALTYDLTLDLFGLKHRGLWVFTWTHYPYCLPLDYEDEPSSAG